MRTIWKVELKAGITQVELPVDHKVLTAQFQRRQICLWVEVETDSPKETQVFEVVGTGIAISPPVRGEKRYISTVQFQPDESSSVFHVYQLVDSVYSFEKFQPRDR
jgi:hypothetical protein